MRALTGLVVLLASAAGAEPGTVMLRNGRTIASDDIRVTEQSLTLEADGREMSLGWQEISEVRGAAGALAAEHLPMAETAWRGLSRLARGDRVAAEPALEAAFQEVGRGVGPTAKGVSEGLLACRVARGAQALGVEPFLYVLLNTANEDVPEGFDPDLRLCENLPPIWGTRSGLSAMVSSISADDFGAWQTNDRVAQIAELYVTAAVHEISGRAPVPDFEPVDDGVRLLYEMVRAQVGDKATRESTRGLLLKRLERDPPAWQRAWLHASLGMSLLVEQDSQSSRLGIVQLLYVPSIYGDDQPYLAGVCLSRAALRLNEMGRRAEAERLAQTFQKEYERHDAGDLPGMKELIQSAESQPDQTDQEDA